VVYRLAEDRATPDSGHFNFTKLLVDILDAGSLFGIINMYSLLQPAASELSLHTVTIPFRGYRLSFLSISTPIDSPSLLAYNL
jgi:hypothetical protein